MSSPSTAGMQFNGSRPPIPLEPRLKPYQTKETKVKHRFRTKEGSTYYTNERKAFLPTFTTDDIEQLIKVILSFNEHCHDDFLHLTKYQDRFLKFP